MFFRSNIHEVIMDGTWICTFELKVAVQLSADLFTFTIEILNGKLHFS